MVVCWIHLVPHQRVVLGVEVLDVVRIVLKAVDVVVPLRGVGAQR